MQKKWIPYKEDKNLVKKVSKKHNLPELISKLLINRQVIDDEKIDIFLNPTRDNFYDPFLMSDMEKAVDRILKAIKNNENILIYGDYDVDGITSIIVLKKFIEEQGKDCLIYMPSRMEEGYGLNAGAIDKLTMTHAIDLIITVDLGITALDEVEYIKEKGIDIIITDHHEPLDELPRAYAIINPKTRGNNYPFRELAGVGVVFKLIQALSIRLGLEQKSFLKYLDLVCVGTIADIVPLRDENRIIAKLGLKLVEVTKNPGLKALLESSKYKKIDSIALSFGIAPRINACGRMGYAGEALELFNTPSHDEAIKIAQNLNNYNINRQEVEKKIFNEVIGIIEQEGLNKQNVIVIGKEGWHQGVIGIVASKISEIYYKPTILVCFEGDVGKGSGRSIEGFDLHKALCKSSQNLEKYGGHEMAVGLSVNLDKFEAFKKNLQEIAIEQMPGEMTPIINADEIITHRDISIDVIREIAKLEPFGEANPVPIFIYNGLKVESIRTLSEGKHIKLTLKDGNKIFDAIGFNLGEFASSIIIGDKVNILTVLEINNWQDVERIQFNIKDIMKSY